MGNPNDNNVRPCYSAASGKRQLTVDRGDIGRGVCVVTIAVTTHSYASRVCLI
jgi:hypothetical protein